MKAILEMVVKKAISKGETSEEKLEGNEAMATEKWRQSELWAKCTQVK